MKYHNSETKTLLELVSQKVTTLRENMYDVCVILAELSARGVDHPAMSFGVLRYYKQVASGQLSPAVAFAFGGVPSIVEKLKDLPVVKQDAIAAGEALPLVSIDAKGAVVVEQKPISRFAQKELDRVIKDGKIVPAKEQEKAARAEATRQPVRATTTSRIQVDRKARQIIFGRMKFSPEDLRDALGELGFRLERIDGKKPRAETRASH